MISRISVKGGQPLVGTTSVSGAKNAALPILAGAILLDGFSSITNVPDLTDVSTMLKMLNALDIRAEFRDNTVNIWNNKKIRHIVPYELVTGLRASFFVAGPLLAKTGFAKVPLPGGCSIGSRPVDIHLNGFKALGADVSIEHGFVQLKAPRLTGNRVYLDFPSVGATENILMAASLAQGDTVIENAAKEPEIVDLGHFLNAAGAKITGLGSSTICISGVETLSGIQYRVIPDRIEAGTLLIAAAITSGDVTVTDLYVPHLESLISKLRDCGMTVQVLSQSSIRITGGRPIRSVDLETLPFPGFPTDMQAQMMTLLTLADGVSVVRETIFENRFMHAQELMRMGAKIKIEGHTAMITGVPSLSSAEVKMTDLRAGASMILAALAAQGDTVIYGMKHLMRGYENLPEKLSRLGAQITC